MWSYQLETTFHTTHYPDVIQVGVDILNVSRDVDTYWQMDFPPHPPITTTTSTTTTTTPPSMHFELELTQPLQTVAIWQRLVVAGGVFFS